MQSDAKLGNNIIEMKIKKRIKEWCRKRNIMKVGVTVKKKKKVT